MFIWPYSADEVLDIVRRIAAELCGPRAGSPEFLAKGSNNAVYAVSDDGRKIIIRVTGEWRKQTTLRERWCYEHAQRLGIPGPTVLGLGQVDKLPYLAMTLVEGHSGSDAQIDSLGIWHTLGRYGRLINSIDIGSRAVTWEGQDVYPDPPVEWKGWIDECEMLLDENHLVDIGLITRDQQIQLGQILFAMRVLNRAFGLSHGDLDHRNTIIAPDGTINLIDYCCSLVSVMPHVDLYNILREEPPDGPTVDAYLKGYGMARAEFERILPEVRAYGLIQRLKRLRWSLGQRPDLVASDTADLELTITNHLPAMATLVG